MRIKILWGEKVVNVSVRKKKKNGSSSVHIKVCYKGPLEKEIGFGRERKFLF